MKFTLLSCLVGLLPYLVVSSPQITQNCSGAHCQQNNVVGRRKREIVAEILAEAVDAVGREERSAPAGHGHDGDHHHTRPVNVPHINISPVHIPAVHFPDIHIPDIHIPDVHVPHVQVPHVPIPQHHQPPQHHESPHHEQPPQHHESPHHESSQHHKRSAPQISQSCSGAHCNQNNVLGSSTGFFGSIDQNCANGACNQNNVASGGHGAGLQFSGPAFQLPSISQNCENGVCNQNNVLNGRRKREVIAQLIEEARKIAEEEVEAEGAISRKKRQISQNILNGIGNQNNVASGGHGAGFQFSGPAFQFPSISQNCANGACNQNNVLGRRKREIIAAILDEAS